MGKCLQLNWNSVSDGVFPTMGNPSSPDDGWSGDGVFVSVGSMFVADAAVLDEAEDRAAAR